MTVSNPERIKCENCEVVLTSTRGLSNLCYVCDREEHNKKMAEMEKKFLEDSETKDNPEENISE